jgi:hypothetical protein
MIKAGMTVMSVTFLREIQPMLEPRKKELGQFSDKKAVFEGKTNLTFIGQAFDWKPMRRGKPLNMKVKDLAEREGFEPPSPRG